MRLNCTPRKFRVGNASCSKAQLTFGGASGDMFPAVDLAPLHAKIGQLTLKIF
jgi:hypothetical protein